MAGLNAEEKVYRRQHVTHNFLLLWLDASFDESKDMYQNSLAQLRNIVNKVDVFMEPNEAIDFLTEDHGVKAFLIVENAIGQTILSLIHDIPQLDGIYIFSNNKPQQEQWTTEWIKIKGVHTEIRSICAALRVAAKQCNHDSIAVSFIPVDGSSANVNINQLEPTFMYTQIFMEILLNMIYDQQSIKKFSTYCRKGDLGTARDIDHFENKYYDKSAIWWYTTSSFIYPMLNAALRFMEGEVIINMGFFIHDLHNQIQQLHQKQLDTYDGRSFTVYRGQGLPVEAFKELQRTRGGLMSFNNFLSTSRDRDISLVFAESASTNTNTFGILFKMSIDPPIVSTPFASIRGISPFEEEEEILFSMHSVFRVGDITKLPHSDTLYQVDLELTRDDDAELRILTERIRQEVADETGWWRLGLLLMKIGQLSKAKELYNELLDQSFDLGERAALYNHLGCIEDQQGNFTKSIEYYEKALAIRQNTLLPNHPLLATSYNNIATAYYSIGAYSKALLFYKKAQEIWQKPLPENHLSLASSYKSIAQVYENTGEYSKALFFYENALEMRQKALPANHPDLAKSYNGIAGVYYRKGEYSKALSFYEKAFVIWQKTLPASHPYLSISHANIAGMYNSMGEYSKALSFYEHALEMQQKVLPASHPHLASSYSNIGSVYHNMGEYSKALSFFEKALEILQKTLPADHPWLSVCCNNIAGGYYKMGEHWKALSILEKALEIDQKTLSANHPDLATSYNNIGMLYKNMGEYLKALSFCDKAIEIFKKALPANHPSLAASYNNIAGVYDNMGEYSKALSFREKAIEMRQKTLSANHPDLVASYNNIAEVYDNMGEYSKSLSFYEKALEIGQKALPANHSSLATSYNNIARVYYNMRYHSKALSYMKRAEKILQTSLPANQSHLTTVRSSIDLIEKKL